MPDFDDTPADPVSAGPSQPWVAPLDHGLNHSISQFFPAMPAGQEIRVGGQTSQYLPLDFTDIMQDVGGVSESVGTVNFTCFTPVLASIRLDDSDDDWELGPLDDDDRHTSWDDDAEPNALNPCISQPSAFAGLNEMDVPGTFVVL